MERDFASVAELFKVLSSATRIQIVHELVDGPVPVHELMHRLDLSQPLVSQHLRVMRGARLVSAERQGREAMYSLTDDHVAHIVLDALNHMEETE